MTYRQQRRTERDITFYNVMLSKTPIEYHITRKLIINKLEMLMRDKSKEAHEAHQKTKEKISEVNVIDEKQRSYLTDRLSIPGWDENF